MPKVEFDALLLVANTRQPLSQPITTRQLSNVEELCHAPPAWEKTCIFYAKLLNNIFMQMALALFASQQTGKCQFLTQSANIFKKFLI
jgi:hypothetical protein